MFVMLSVKKKIILEVADSLIFMFVDEIVPFYTIFF